MSLASDGFECFKAFVALKLHFNTKYDIFEKKGRVNMPPEAYARRDDYYLFERLVKAHPTDYKKVLLANFAYANIGHVTEIDPDRYIEWKKRRESLTYKVKTDLETLDALSIHKAIHNDFGSHPPLLQKFIGGRIMLETVTLLDHALHFYPAWDKMFHDDFIWQSIGPRLKKFSGFMKPRNELVFKLIDEVF